MHSFLRSKTIQVFVFPGHSFVDQGLLIENPFSFISVQAATDSVCRLQQREQERKKVKVDHLGIGASNFRTFIIIILIAFD